MSSQTINPMWTAYNNLHNEGGDGYNPHPQYVGTTDEPQWSILEDRKYRAMRIANATSTDDPRWEQLQAEIATLDAAIKIAHEQDI